MNGPQPRAAPPGLPRLNEAREEAARAAQRPGNPPAGMDWTDSAGSQFLVPIGVRREHVQDLVRLGQPLEAGMVANDPSCSRCTSKGIHCTLGSGRQGKTGASERKTGEAACDLCLFIHKSCDKGKRKKSKVWLAQEAVDGSLEVLERVG